MRSGIIATIMSTLLIGSAIAQPPPPPPNQPPPPNEPRPNAGQQNSPPQFQENMRQPPQQNRPAEVWGWRLVVVPAPTSPAPVYTSYPAPHRCGFFARLCGNCCESSCEPCSFATACGGLFPGLGCGYAYYLVPVRLERLPMQLNPQPLPPRGPMPRRMSKAITPERSAESLYQEAVTFYRDQDMTTALKLVTAAIQRDPQDAASWYFKALADRASAKQPRRRNRLAGARRWKCSTRRQPNSSAWRSNACKAPIASSFAPPRPRT